MRGFFYYFSGCAIAAMLLASGLGHLLQPGKFRLIIRRHGMMPRWMAAPAATAITLLELGGGAAAVSALVTATGGRAVFLGALALGLGFLAYLVRLLRMPLRAESCGCSVVESPLTPVSAAPAALLTASALLGLAADGAATMPAAALGAAWGVTLAGLALLAPAAMPESNAR